MIHDYFGNIFLLMLQHDLFTDATVQDYFVKLILEMLQMLMKL